MDENFNLVYGYKTQSVVVNNKDYSSLEQDFMILHDPLVSYIIL